MKRNYKIFITTILLILSNFLLQGTVCFAGSFNLDFVPASSSYLLYSLNTNDIVCQKDIHLRVPPASLIKIMTYIVVVENVPDVKSATTTVKKDIVNSLYGTQSSLSGLKIGEVVTIEQLLYCMLVRSGNDAARVLADYVCPGDVQGFCNKMNQKAKNLGCTDTNFVNVEGLHDENNYTSAHDLLLITKHALTLPYFKEITSTVTSYIMGQDRFPLITTMLLQDKQRGGKYYYQYAKGIKTGSHNQAGHCIISTAKKGEYEYLCIALHGGEVKGDNLAMIDSKNIYEWAFNNLQLKPILSDNKPVAQLPLKFAWQKDTVLLAPSGNLNTLLPKNVLASSINVKIDSDKAVKAGVKKGQKLGTATLTFANQPIKTVDLVSMEDVKRSNIVFILYILRVAFTSVYFNVLLILIAVFLIATLIKHKMNQKKKITVKRRKFKR